MLVRVPDSSGIGIWVTSSVRLAEILVVDERSVE